MTTIKDSGKRASFTTGAVRDTDDDKPRLELVSPLFEDILGRHVGAGAKKYAARNWEKGIPMSRSLGSLKRHIRAYQEGLTDEDHLAAAACNIMFLIHTREAVKRGLLPAELADVPSYVPPVVKKSKAKPEAKPEFRYFVNGPKGGMATNIRMMRMSRTGRITHILQSGVRRSYNDIDFSREMADLLERGERVEITESEACGLMVGANQ